MGFWGWRQGVYAAFISVLVTACAPVIPISATPSATLPPLVTLTVVKPPGVTPTARAPRVLTATPAPSSEPAGLSVMALPPQCQELWSGELQCLGLVVNLESTAVVWVVLHTGGSEASGPPAYALEQPIIGAGMSAPYRLWVDEAADEVIVSLEALPLSDGLPWVVLDVREQSATQDIQNGYQVLVWVTNPHPYVVERVRAVVMLLDGDAVLAYRVVELGELSAGESVEVALGWMNISGRGVRAVVSGYGWAAVR